jgi:hypothetical protein
VRTAPNCLARSGSDLMKAEKAWMLPWCRAPCIFVWTYRADLSMRGFYGTGSGGRGFWGYWVDAAAEG